MKPVSASGNYGTITIWGALHSTPNRIVYECENIIDLILELYKYNIANIEKLDDLMYYCFLVKDKNMILQIQLKNIKPEHLELFGCTKWTDVNNLIDWISANTNRVEAVKKVKAFL